MTDHAYAGLDVNAIHVAYGKVVALAGLSFRARPGTITALLGANGAGKTTTLRAVSGLLAPSSGSVTYDDGAKTVDIAGLPPYAIVRRGVAHVPEGRQMFAEMSVLQNLRLGAHLRHRRETAQTLERVIAYFPVLGQRHGQAAGTLSGGEQQMLAIGRGLMSRPRLLLLDEPSLGLAPRVVGEIFEVIRRLRDQEGLTIVLVEQNARLALTVADQGYVIANGRVVLDGTGKELLDDEQVQASYLGV